MVNVIIDKFEKLLAVRVKILMVILVGLDNVRQCKPETTCLFHPFYIKQWWRTDSLQSLTLIILRPGQYQSVLRYLKPLDKPLICILENAYHVRWSTSRHASRTA